MTTFPLVVVIKGRVRVSVDHLNAGVGGGRQGCLQHGLNDLDLRFGWMDRWLGEWIGGWMDRWMAG